MAGPPPDTTPGPTSGLDYSWARPSLPSLKDQGYTFVVRYLSYDTTGKNLTRDEADQIAAAGLDIVSNWEWGADSVLEGFDSGVKHAKEADAQARADGMPEGRPIYFSIDFDAQPDQQEVVNAYFDGVASVIGLDRTGVYAGLHVIERLFDAGKITWGWQCAAWSYGVWDPRAQLRQVENGIGDGGEDADEATTADFGQWRPARQDQPPEQPPAPVQPVATVGQAAADTAASYPDGTPMLDPNWHDGEWCAEFVEHCWGNAGANLDGLTPGAGSFVGYGRDKGTLHTDSDYTPQVGDAVVYNYNGAGYADHVNIVTAVSPDGTVTLEDGNWGNVTHRERPISDFHVGSKNDSGQTVSAIISPVAAGGIPLAAVDDNGVVAGPNQQLVAVAHPSALHSGGQPVVTGSSSVFVGEQRSPLARQGDRTADGGVIVDQTNESVYAA